TLWFERNDASLRADLLREEDRMRADVGADVDHDVARREKEAEQLELGLRPFAVEVQRPADVHVVDVIEQVPVTAAPAAIEPGVDKEGRIQAASSYTSMPDGGQGLGPEP